MALTDAGRRLRRDDWSALDASDRTAWIAGLRPPAPDADVAEIVEQVRRDGDAALRELTRRLDGVSLEGLFVGDRELDAAEQRVPETVRRALEEAAAAIRRYHADQRDALRVERPVRTGSGVVAWRRWLPLRRVGGYVPGGRASYPSTVLMLGIPARLAGCEELVITTPPRSDGSVDPAVLFAARLVGATQVLRVGGAQAIAALAYGTESVGRVDRIFGAGNAWVTAAKRLVSADTPIDLPAGPSECVVVADAEADPELVALDILAQAEHGPDSVAILVTDAPAFADEVDRQIALTADGLAAGEAALETLARWGHTVLVADMAQAIAVVNAVAPEHASLQFGDADALSASVRNAGSLFIGPWSAIAAGDYATGTNHVLPTGGAARAFSGVSVESFGRWMEVQRVSAAGARRLAPVVDAIAAAEGLPAHAASVMARANRAADALAVDDDPLDLLRRPGPVVAYPAEASDEELAAQAGVPLEALGRYDMNTLGGGPLPGAAAAVAGFSAERVVEYNDLAYRRLRAALGEGLGVDPLRIIPGAGADELIRLVTTAVLGPGDAAIVPVPTFPMFAVEAQLAGARVVNVPRMSLAERQPAAALRAAAERESARLVWLCTPNNPTGDRYALDEIRELADGLPAIVAVDEVYLEFAEADADAEANSMSALQLKGELPNVFVLRSMSKAYGLAAARLGYLVVPPQLAERFDAIRLPLSVSGLSEAIAMGVLDDPAAARERQRQIVAERRKLATALERLGCEVLPSTANFVTFRPGDAASLASQLFARGIVLRHYEGGPAAGWLRATARDTAENDRLIAALEELLA